MLALLVFVQLYKTYETVTVVIEEDSIVKGSEQQYLELNGHTLEIPKKFTEDIQFGEEYTVAYEYTIFNKSGGKVKDFYRYGSRWSVR